MKIPSLLVTSLVVAASSSAAFAQTTKVPSATSQRTAPTSQNQRVQLHTLENVFVSAVQGGVNQIARQISEVFPMATILAGAPRAHGYQLDGYGWFFDVEVPGLQPAMLDLYVESRRPTPSPRSAGNVVNGAEASAVQDPTALPVFQNPTKEYRRVIREAIVDAIIDFGQPVKQGEWLTVGARPADSPGGVSADESIPMVFRILGDDLQAFRQEKITRAEVKSRIKIREDKQ